MWGLTIGAPGLLKTPALNEALAPLKVLEARAREQFAAEMAAHRAAETAAELIADEAKKRARATLAKNANADIAKLLKLDAVAEPVQRRYMANNATTEALGEILKSNPNGILNARDEMMALLHRLDEEGQSEARGFYLEAWAGTSGYNFDRIGRGLDNYIPAVCISMIGGTQPARISRYVDEIRRGGRGNDGLLQRFGLMVWPDITRTWENIDRYPKMLAREMATSVFETLDELDPLAVGARQDKIGDKKVGLPYLRLAPDAQNLFLEWRTILETRLRTEEMDPLMHGHLGKYRKLVPSIALIIHLADAEPGQAVDVSTAAVRKALLWAAYLETHAARVYGSGDVSAVEAANAIIAKVRSGHLKSAGFSSRDVWRPGWARLKDRDVAASGLRVLTEYDWLRSAKIETGGRTATVYTVNPKVLA